MELIDGIAVFGDPMETSALDQIRRAKAHPAVRAAALMADHHKGYAVPIGGVVAYHGAISPRASATTSRRRVARSGHRRGAAGLQAAAGRAPAPQRNGPHPAHALAHRRRDGGSPGVRPLQGLTFKGG